MKQSSDVPTSPKFEPTVSLVICTRNRAAALGLTLQSLSKVRIPEDLSCELLIVDNGSTDETRETAKSFSVPRLPTSVVWEPRRGKGYACNTGMSAARGHIFLFTDDDVRLPTNWISAMCEPILLGRTDAVAGGVVIAPHLQRSWMGPAVRAAFACTEQLDAQHPAVMVGANMAFSASVREKVPWFDPELGPGAYGVDDESLFSFQLVTAGYRLTSAFDIEVEHHFQQERLLRRSLASAARGHGHSHAYVSYHWRHERPKGILRSILHPRMRVGAKTSLRTSSEGMEDHEFLLRMHRSFVFQSLRESVRPRNYRPCGLTKIYATKGLPDTSNLRHVANPSSYGPGRCAVAPTANGDDRLSRSSKT